MAGELVDDALRQIGAMHIGDRRRVDRVSRRPAEQTAEESQARLGPVRNAGNRSEPMGVVKQALPAWRAPVSSTVTKGETTSPARSTASSSTRKLSSLVRKLGAQEPHHLPLGNRPMPARGATIRSQVIWP